MKIPSLKILSLAALGAACLLPASAAVSDTVGYISVDIAGNTSGNPSGAATFIAPTLVESSVFVGTSTNSPAASATLNFTGNVPTNLDDTYVLEITTGSYEGWWTAIASSTATSITTTASLPADFVGQAAVAVRKFTTIDMFLGDNSIGLEDFDGAKADFDEIQVLDPINQSTRSIVYVLTSTGVAQDGWHDVVSTELAGDTIIYPGTAVKVVRRKSTPLSLTNVGNVKTTKTIIEISPNFNWLGQPLAVGDTLSKMNFAEQLVQFDNVSDTYDTLDIITPSQEAVTYVALDPTLGMGEIMANIVTTEDASNVVMSEGSGYILHRDPSNSGGSITIPGQIIGN